MMAKGNFNKDFDAGSPSEDEKKRIVYLSFECTKNKANSYQDLKEKHKFNHNVEDLLYRLLRYMPDKLKQEIEGMFDDMEKEREKIKESNLTEQKKQKEEIEMEFEYYRKLHRINIQVLPRSTIYEQDVAGELDITDEKAIAVIRGEAGGERDEIPAKFGD